MAATVAEVLSQRDLYGKKVYLLGTAELGPVNTPIRANSISHVISIFGNTGTLVEAYKTIRETNLDCEVYLCKITGVHSETYLNINQQARGVSIDGLYIKSKHANEMYNEVTFTIDPTSLYITYSQDSSNEYVIEYKYSDYETMHDFVESINEDTRQLKNHIYCYADCEPQTLCQGALAGVNPYTARLSGGNSGLYYNKNMLYNCLSETYSILEGVEIDIIIPLGVNYDDVFTDDSDSLHNYYNLDREYLTLKSNGEYLTYYNQLLQFCKNQMRFGLLTHGVMSLSLTENPFLDEGKYLDTLRYFKELNKVKLEDRKYQNLISVVAGDLYTTFGTRIVNGAVPYGVLIASLNVIDTTTNKMLPDTFTTFNTFSIEALNVLKDLGFTSFRYSPLKKAVVVSNGVTMSEDESFKFLCNVRMSQLTMCYVKTLLSSYIGENIEEIIKTRSLEQGLIELLNELVNLNIIKGFSINEIINPITGHIFLDMSFKTIYMIEEVNAYSGLASRNG